MDFGKSTTDDLLALLPAGNENDRWELKSAELLSPHKRGDLRKELGKQVSAFANSGGGCLVFGISKSGQLEPCEEVVGRQLMKDHLSTLVELCVEYPIRHFRVHRVPFSEDPQKSVFVVEIEDSPAAPHQAKEVRGYFYRIDGHSLPAPHFHIELLRSRATKAVLEVVDIDYVFQMPDFYDEKLAMNIALQVKVKNTSMQSATSWGIHARHPRENCRWMVTRTAEDLCEGICVQGDRPVLLPGQRDMVTLHLQGRSPHARMQPSLAIEKLWEEFEVVVQAVSQNFIGPESHFGWHEHAEWIKAQDRVLKEAKRAGFG